MSKKEGTGRGKVGLRRGYLWGLVASFRGDAKGKAEEKGRSGGGELPGG